MTAPPRVHGGCVALAAVLALAPACHRSPDRAAALAGLVRTVVLPSYAALHARARELTAATRALETGDDPPARAAAKEAWRQALLALERTYAFRRGPIQDSQLHLHAAYWPVRPASIEALAAAPALAEAVEQAGAAARGLYAMEYLLFAAPPDPRRRALLRVLAADFEESVQEVEAAARARDWVAAFTGRPQDALAQVSTDLVETAETIVSGRVELARTAAQQPTRQRGHLGGVSLAATRALLEGVQMHYRGGAAGAGLSPLVQATAPDIDRAIGRALAQAEVALGAMDAPLEVVARTQPQRLADAGAACRTLEVALKTGLVSALGIALHFVSVDGD